MLTRRSFLYGAGAAATMLPATRLEAQPQGELPQSIRALTSMRSQLRPITAEERRGRVAKARRLMAEQKMDALMLCSGSSLVYFTNITWSGGERLFNHDRTPRN
jgi:Xaa-Pro dipeptidase